LNSESFSGHIQVNVWGVNRGRVTGNVNVSTTESGRAWVDDQTELTGGNSVNIDVGGNLHNKGAVIANVDENGIDKGNLQVAVGGDLTHEDILDKDKSTTRGVGISFSGGKGSSNATPNTITYNDSKKEGITRATIGNGTITIGGKPATEEQLSGINRDIKRAQEITFNEGMKVTVEIPEEVVTAIVSVVASVASSISRVLAGDARNDAEKAILASRDKLMKEKGLTEEQANAAIKTALDVLSGKITLEASSACGGSASLWDYINPISSAHAAGATCDAENANGHAVSYLVMEYKATFDNYLATYKNKTGEWLADKYVESDDPIEKAAIFSTLVAQQVIQPGSSEEVVLMMAGGAIAKGAGAVAGRATAESKAIWPTAGHAIDRLLQRGITKTQGDFVIETGTKYFDKSNNSIVYWANSSSVPGYNGSSKMIGIAIDPQTKIVKTVMKRSSNNLPTNYTKIN
jgi:hypothetical protein